MPRPAKTLRLSPALALSASLALLTGCFPFNGPVSKDYATFSRYTFAQTPGLGFCGDTTTVFAARIDRTDDGTMTYTATRLHPNGQSSEACDDVPTEQGCMSPRDEAPRALTAAMASRVTAAFADVAVHPGPEKICRTIAIDPCRIDRHSWDDTTHSDYVCGADRLDTEQSRALLDLLTSLDET